MTERRRVVRVPASSANLGPGYDCMAVALDLHLELEVAEADTFSVESEIPGLELDRENLVVRAFEALHPVDRIAFRISGEIPVSRGLGSSAAAIVAGLVAADHMFELGLEKPDLLERATGIEGHPDNVAAALYGGFVLCSSESGFPLATRIEAPEGLEGVLVIPTEEVATDLARESVPAEVPIEEAVANASAAAHLALGLARGDFDLIGQGLSDRIHQERRRHLFPRSMEVVDVAEECGAIGATISGAGPTVLVWSGWQETGSVVEHLRERCGDWAEVRRVGFSPVGADVPEV
ncbi:MAG: homoserine kinase [Solirubrobacterales bacterium]